MADIWPSDAYAKFGSHPDEPLRPFHCLILMPFDSKRFGDLARRIESTVRNITENVLKTVQIGPARIERLESGRFCRRDSPPTLGTHSGYPNYRRDFGESAASLPLISLSATRFQILIPAP
jgi:hypothetical protein